MRRSFFILVSFVINIFPAYCQELSLVYPKNESYVLPDEPITFRWNKKENADTYSLKISQDPTFQTIDFQVANLTSNSFAYNSPSGMYYWQVTAHTGAQNVLSNTLVYHSFEPSDIPELSLWLDADEGLSVDGSNLIDSWTDKSSNTFQLSQSNPSKKPYQQLDALNHRPAMHFSGGQVLNGGDILDIGTNSRSMFVVGKMGASNQTFFAKSLLAGAPNRYALLKESTPYFLYSDNGNGAAGCAMTEIKYALYSVRSDRSSSKNYFSVDNFCLTSGNISSSYNMNSIFRFLIGAYNNATDNGEALFLNGDINEIVFIETSDTSKVRTIQSYLRYKYCPPIDLGKDTTIANNFCPINLNIETGFTNVLWSTGETVGTISINQPGLYWVRGTDLFGYVSYDTVQVNYPEIQAPNSEFICLGQSVGWDAGLGSNYTYNWTTGATTESINITTPGGYSVTVTDQLGCTRISDPIIFTTDYYEATTYLGADTSLCTGNPIALQVGAAETVSYAWQGNTASSAPSYAVAGTGNYWVESVNVNGCVARDTIFITNVGTAPIAQFSVSDHCKGLSSGIVDQSTGVGPDNVVLWHWNLGDGTELSQQTVNYTYPAAGNYPIELYVQSAGGCGAYHYDTVQVFETPQADFNFIGHCQGQEVLFTEGAVLGGAPISSYSWNFDMPWMGAYNTSTINIPNRIFDEVGTYDVVLQVTDGNGCQDAVTLPVVIDPTPVANYVFESTCQGSPIQFLNTSVTQASSTYLWDFGDNTSSILVNPAKTFPDYGIVPVQLSVTNLSGCTDTVLQNVQVFAFPLTSLQIGPACMDSYTTLENTSTVPLGAIDSTIWILNQTDTLFGADAAWMVNAMGQQQVDMF
ncbi:MAG: PKD domain-containing protein, partial [Flavobacteriia bacterium]